MSNYPPPGYPPGQPAPAAPQYGYPPPPPPPRSGCGGCLGKLLILLGVVFLLLIAICCGGFFYVKSSLTEQPADVQKISDEIASFHVPAPLEPVGGGRIKVPLAGTLVAQGAAYSDKEHTSVLFIMSFGSALGQGFKDQLLQGLESGQFQKSGGNNPNNQQEELKDIKKSHIDRTIQGQKAVFEISEGTGVQSNKRKIRVQGAFVGKTGPAILVIEAEEKTLPMEKVKEFIESIE